MVHLENIYFGYSAQKNLLHGLSLEATAGSIHGLLGKNGAGKTSLLKIISGLRKPQSGNVNVLGFNPGERKMQFNEQYYFVPEELYTPTVSAKTYISLYAGYYPNFSQNKMASYMESFDLEPDMHLGRVSYGQKKKFILSFAMASGTRLVLFDEPTNGLDIPSKSVFRKLAASAISDERCFIISTHQVRDLNLLLDSVILLHKGEILLNTPLHEIASKYAFVTLPRKHTNDNVIFSEEHIEGIKAIIPCEAGMETEVDLEVLFNAAITGKISLTPQYTC
jgi:ABC-2 type transport system ATP-binding protein